MEASPGINEQKAAAAFDAQSARFDDLYGEDTIIAYKRERVYKHLLSFIEPGASILELNAGTGTDAIFLAKLGYKVHATDLSPGMIQKLSDKLRIQGITERVTTELCSYHHLNKLQHTGPYDLIFSNFAGLNCTGELDKVLNSFSGLVRPGGKITLVVLPRFCLWETLLFFKGKWKTAFRRFFSARGRKASIEGHSFNCYYYDPAYIINSLRKDFRLLKIEGLCSFVPPSYIKGFAEKYPHSFQRLCKLEERRGTSWPWRSIGDYYIISFEKT